MALLQVVLFLMMCAVALGWVARHFKFPYPIALVIGGAALGFVPRLPQLQFDPQFLLVLVLPPILYQAALLTSWHEFKANIRPIGLLAIGLVIATTLAVGATLKLLIPDIPWSAAFVLGAIVSPPDVAAATAILSRLNIPRNVVTVLEGESLVNDASGLVIYKFAVAAVLTGVFSLWQASLEFVGVAVGGVVIGLVMGRLFVFIHRYLGDAFIEVLTTLGVEPARVPAEHPDLYAHRRAALGNRRAAHRLFGGGAFFLRHVRECGRDLRALRLGLSCHLPAAGAEGLARRASCASPGGGGVHHGLVRDARHRVAGRRPRAAPDARRRECVSRALPDHLSHLRRYRGHACSAGADPEAAYPHAQGRPGLEPAGGSTARPDGARQGGDRRDRRRGGEKRHPERTGRTHPRRIRREDHALGAGRSGAAALRRRRRAPPEGRGGEGRAAGTHPAVARKPDQRRGAASYRGRPRLPGIAHLARPAKEAHDPRRVFRALRAGRRAALRGAVSGPAAHPARRVPSGWVGGHRYARRRRRDEAEVSLRH